MLTPWARHSRRKSWTRSPGSVRSTAHEQKKWVAANVLAAHPASARTLVRELLRAGVREQNPSFNRAFVIPLKPHVTYEDAVVLGLELIETEADAGGLARLEYWLEIELGPGTLSTQRAMNRWRIESFLCVSDGYARRSLLAGISFAKAHLDTSAARLARRVIAIASSSDDAYLRHRLQNQRRDSAAFPALLPPGG